MTVRTRTILVALVGSVGLALVAAPSPAKTISDSKATSYKLPWTSGATWNVTGGRHPDSAWDFQPATGPGSHNDPVLAVADGTARRTCGPDSVGQVIVELETAAGIFGYVHLEADAVAAAGVTSTGTAVKQGATLGRLHPNPPGADPGCGYAEPAGASHLHLEFPTLPFTLDGTTFTNSGPDGGSLTSSNDPAGQQEPFTSASSSVTVDKAGRVWMFATKANGTLYYRHTVNGPSGWDKFRRVGSAKSWSPSSSPSVVTDDKGQVWMFAVKKSGVLYYRHTNPDAAGWQSYRKVGNGSWSTTSAPTLTVDKAGRVWMFATKANGTLYYRHTVNGPSGWDKFRKVGNGNWAA